MDFILDAGGALHPIEIKAAETLDPSMSKGLTTWRNLGEKYLDNKTAQSMVIYGGEQDLTMGNHRFVPWHRIEAAFQEINT